MPFAVGEKLPIPSGSTERLNTVTLSDTTYIIPYAIVTP